ncbi:MAG: hypothetical protein M1821_004879 [Bathelium mastoideum]|nr:MAG: hypothetical protein M1821_004879 [Bathelium mastoideum]
MDASWVSIRYRATQCLDLFQTLLGIETNVERSGDSSELRLNESRTEDQLARFEMWAGNIGVFAEGHASLDYRLKDNDDATKFMVEFLGTLWGFLRRAIEALGLENSMDVIPSSIPSQDSDSHTSSDAGKLSESSIVSSFQGTETESVLAAVPAEVPPFLQRIQGVERTIDRLYRLSLLIRQPSITGQNAKAEKFPITDDEGNNIDDEFAAYALEVTTHKFPDAPGYLRERLARGILVRRKRFLFRQSHQRKLSTRTVATVDTQQERRETSGSQFDNASTVRAFRVLVDAAAQDVDGTKKVLGPQVPSQTSASAMADNFPVEKVMVDEESKQSTIFTNPVTRTNPVLVPDAPKLAPGSKEFECPYCCIILPVSNAKASKWSPSEEELRRDIHRRDSVQFPRHDMDKIASDHIIKHLSIHLESLAVTALPWLDTVEDVQSERAQSEISDEDIEQDDGDSLASHGKRSISSLLSEEFTTELTWPDEDDTGDVASNDGSYEEEWGFVPLPDYFGHNRDPVLQTLLRRHYLDTPFPGSLPQQPGPTLPLYYVPRDQDKNFFARKHTIQAIEQSLCSVHTEEMPAATKPVSFPRCFAVYGPGGMGKTQIAQQLVTTHRSQFDAIMWVNAENSSKILQDFNGIAIQLGLVSKDSIDATDQSFTRDIVKRWLVRPLKRQDKSSKSRREMASWLLVFDGVEDGEILNEFWPYDGPGSILVTTRTPYSWTTCLELKPFSIEEATEYLKRITGRRDMSEEEEAAAVKIARRLGGLPLALAQMGAIVCQRSVSFREFLRSYEGRDGQQEFLQWNIDKVRPQLSNYEHNVASVWAFDSLGRGAKLLLSILSRLDSDKIPEHLFEDSVATGDPLDLRELKQDYKTARNELLTRSLITRNKRDRALFIHRLVQDVITVRMGSSELRTTFFNAVRLVSGKWPFEKFRWRHSVKRWSLCEELLPHVESLKETYPEITPSIDSFEDYEFAELLIDAGWYRHERGKSTEAGLFNNMAQSICESMKLRLLQYPEHVDDGLVSISKLNSSLSEISHNRGCIALEINEPQEALKYHKHFNNTMVQECAREATRDDMRLAISWNELGNSYMLCRNWSKGENCFLRSIEEMKRLDDFVPTMVSLPVANLGLAYWLQGNHREALATLENGLRERQATFGLDDRVSFITGRFLHALGNVKASLGDQDAGFEYHRRTLIHYRSTLGNHHHRTADVFVKVAEHNIRLRQNELALALLEHAIGAYSNAHHFAPEQIRASYKRVQALRALRREDEANLELSKCFRLYNVLYTNLIRNVGVREEDRKAVETDLSDADVDELIAFWSK